MDSHKFHGVGGRYSKAQMCLQKILSIICSIPPHQQQNPEPKRPLLQALDSSSSSNSPEKAQPFGHQGFHFDLNLELASSSPEIENGSIGIDSTEEKERGNPISEIGVEDEKTKKPPSCSSEFEREEGSLSLLTEGGELSPENGGLPSGGPGTELATHVENAKGKGSVQEGRECWVVDLHGRFDDVSQVARTKRGRRRVLPCRYKDSVLQPLARNAGSRKRHRLNAMN